MTLPTALTQDALGTRKPKEHPSFAEQTSGQVFAWGNTTRSQGFGIQSPYLYPLLKEAHDNTTEFYKKVRLMRRHPTVRLVRQLLVATMAQAPWSVETKDNAPEGATEFIEEMFLPQQDLLMTRSICGSFDFGWQPWEKVFNYHPETMQVGIGKFKPLLQDQTDIVIKTSTGEYAGVKQFDVYLKPSNAMLINRDVEGTYFYGEGAMKSIETAFNRHMVTDDANVRYDNKISGAHWVVKYPEGASTFNGRKGVDNATIANAILTRLEGSGSVVIPQNVLAFKTNLDAQAGGSAWDIELITADAAAQAGFQQRLAYLDAMIVRAAGFPERSILEGQYGTKAEAGEHADFAVENMDHGNKQITTQINKSSVNQVLALNYGSKAADSVYLKCAPIADDKLDTIKAVYMAAIANPAVGVNELQQLDMQAIRDKVGLPTLAHDEMGNSIGGPDYTQGTGRNGFGDPMLERMLANLNTNENAQPQLPTQMGA